MHLDLFNYGELAASCVSWFKTFFHDNKGEKAVIGISGGKDSTVAATIACKALGKENVIGVLMPNGQQADIDDSMRVVKTLGIEYVVVNIEKPYKAEIDAIVDAFGGDEFVKERLAKNTQAGINLAPRIRMATLYCVAQMQTCRAFVVNTTNMSEAFVGYGTLWGDTTGDLAPLANCTVEMVIGIGKALGIAQDLVEKTPSDGLSGLSDEDNLGVTYNDIQTYILKSCNFLGSSIDYNLNADAENKIRHLHKQSQFKRDAIHVKSFKTPLSSALSAI